jgi:hypothetical protein
VGASGIAFTRQTSTRYDFVMNAERIIEWMAMLVNQTSRNSAFKPAWIGADRL